MQFTNSLISSRELLFCRVLKNFCKQSCHLGIHGFYFFFSYPYTFYFASFPHGTSNSFRRKLNKTGASWHTYLITTLIGETINVHFNHKLCNKEEQTWLHTESIPLALTCVVCCLCLVMLTLHQGFLKLKRMLPSAWNIQDSPFSGLWSLEV